MPDPLFAGVDYEDLTVDNTAGGVAFNASKVASVGVGGKVVCRLEGAEIRFRVDGGAPTTTVGTALEVGDQIEVTGKHDLQAFRAIRTGGTSGTLRTAYFQG